jgi:kumamolisin
MSTQNPQHSLSRVPLPKSEHKTHPGATAAGRTGAQRIISVSVIVKRKNPLDLEKMIGQHISQEEFSEKYAADPGSFNHLREFAHKHGLTVDEGASSLARRTMVLRGPASKMESAFGVTINDYEKEGKRFHSYRGTISMPREYAELVEAVLGLDNHPIAMPHFRLLDKQKKGRQTRHPADMASFNPPQVAQLYSFPAGVNGAGQTIGILELGGGYNASDLSSYFAGLGIAEPRVTAVSVDGATNSPNLPTDANVDGEVTLDIEVAGSIAYGANIVVYFTANTSQGFVDALTTAIHDTTNGPLSVISISWGSAESNWTAQSMTSFDDACQSAAALGITIVVASGSNGSSDGGSGNNVDFPASSPHVLGCGGTELIAGNPVIKQETVWNDQPQGGATGGGVSSVFGLPPWQAKANVPRPPTSGGGRGVPDVAGNASPESGYNVLFDGQSQIAGGTSAVAPLWASLVTLINQQRGSNIGFANVALYQNAENGFHDITQGNNGSYSAGPGWDPCCGLGSPNGNQLSQIFAATETGPARVSEAHGPQAAAPNGGRTYNPPFWSPRPESFTAASDTGREAEQSASKETQDATLVQVFYATDRMKVADLTGSVEYGAERSTKGTLYYGRCEVSIPESHEMGKLETPSILRLEFRPNPKRHIILSNTYILGEDAFFELLNASVAKSAAKDAFVFVHGYNVSFEDAARRTGQIAYDLAFVGAPIFYSWPSNCKVADYLKDDNNMTWSTPHLEYFLNLLAYKSRAERIHIIAHSMGNRGVCDALKALSYNTTSQLKFNHLVLAAPDIDADTFQELAATLQRLASRVTLYESSQDKALQVSKMIRGNPRAGEPLLVVRGMDTIDASAVDTDFLGHSYFSNNWPLLSDIHSILFSDEPASGRFGLVEREHVDGKYYAFKR